MDDPRDIDAARAYIAVDPAPAILYIKGPHNSGKTTKTLPAMWRVAREEGYSGIYLMSSRIETDLLSL
jgi:hypothetical protein